MLSEIKGDLKVLNENLIHAIKTGAMPAFEQALSRSASVEATDQYSNTALMIAVGEQHLPMTERLIAAGANLNALSEFCPQSALHIAARHDSLEMTELLLKHGAELHIWSRRCQTPLHVACKAGKMTQVRLLLDHGARETQGPDTSFDSAFIAALVAGHFDIASYLLVRKPELFKDGDSYGLYPLQRFAYWKSHVLVAWLLDQPMPDWLKLDSAYFRDAAASAVEELADYEQGDDYEAARAATMELFRARGYL